MPHRDAQKGALPVRSSAHADIFPMDSSMLTNRELQQSVRTGQAAKICELPLIPLAEGISTYARACSQPPPTIQESCWFTSMTSRLLGCPCNTHIFTNRQTEQAKSTVLSSQLIWDLPPPLLPKLKSVPWQFHTHITIISYLSLWKQVR